MARWVLPTTGRRSHKRFSRSEVLTEVPLGSVRRKTNGIEKTPERQVQEAIVEVFLKSEKKKMIETVPAPCTHPPGVALVTGREKFRGVVTDAMRTAGSALGLAGYNRNLAILKNPVYAGCV